MWSNIIFEKLIYYIQKKSNEKNGNGNIGFLCNYICNEINKKSLHAEHKLHIFTTNVIIILIGFKWICSHGNIYFFFKSAIRKVINRYYNDSMNI